MRATVYTIRSADGTVLYVGCTTRGFARITEHFTKSWWGEVATIETTHFDDRSTALAAEARAIVALRPVHNVQHNPVPAISPLEAAIVAHFAPGGAWAVSSGARLRELRGSGWTLDGLARAIKSHGSAISRYERGEAIPPLHVRAALAFVMDVEIGSLWPMPTFDEMTSLAQSVEPATEGAIT